MFFPKFDGQVTTPILTPDRFPVVDADRILADSPVQLAYESSCRIEGNYDAQILTLVLEGVTAQNSDNSYIYLGPYIGKLIWSIITIDSHPNFILKKDTTIVASGLCEITPILPITITLSEFDGSGLTGTAILDNVIETDTGAVGDYYILTPLSETPLTCFDDGAGYVSALILDGVTTENSNDQKLTWSCDMNDFDLGATPQIYAKIVLTISNDDGPVAYASAPASGTNTAIIELNDSGISGTVNLASSSASANNHLCGGTLFLRILTGIKVNGGAILTGLAGAGTRPVAVDENGKFVVTPLGLLPFWSGSSQLEIAGGTNHVTPPMDIFVAAGSGGPSIAQAKFTGFGEMVLIKIPFKYANTGTLAPFTLTVLCNDGSNDMILFQADFDLAEDDNILEIIVSSGESGYFYSDAKWGSSIDPKTYHNGEGDGFLLTPGPNLTFSAFIESGGSGEEIYFSTGLFSFLYQGPAQDLSAT